MAQYTLTTNARQEEALAYVLTARNAKRAAEGKSPYVSIQAMLSDEFAGQLRDAMGAMRNAEAGKLMDAFEQATVQVRQQVRQELGYTLP